MLHWKKRFFEIILILTLGTISLSWFSPGKLILGTDTIVPLRLATIDEYFYIWSGRMAPGSIDINKLAFLLPVGILLKGWSILGLPYSPEIYERLLVYTLFSGAGLSVYSLYGALFKNSTSWGRIASAVFAMFNFYVLFIFTPMPITLLFSYCFFPAVMAKFVNFLRLPSIKSALLFVIIWALLLTASYTTPPYLILHWLILFSYLLFFLLTERPDHKWRLIFFCAISLAIWFLIEAFWLIPLLTNIKYQVVAYGASTQSDKVALQLLNSAPLYDAFRLMGYFGFNSSFESSRFYPWYEIFRTPTFIILTFMVPIIAFSGFLSKRRERPYMFFALMALLFIFFTKGSYEPLGAANLYIFNNFDLLVIFRTAYQRFTGFTALAFAIMVAYTLEKVFIRLWRGKLGSKLICTLLFLVSVVIIPAAIGFPIWTGKLFQSEGVLPSQRIKIPTEYFNVADWLETDKEESNTLPIPFNGGGQSSFWWNDGKDGYGAIYPFESIINKRFVISNVEGNISQLAATGLISGDPESITLLGFLNVRYVLYHQDSNWKMVNHHSGWISAEPEKIGSGLRSLNGLSLVKQFPSIDVYAVKDEYFLPKFYTPARVIELEKIEKSAPVRTVYFPSGRDSTSMSEALERVKDNLIESPLIVFQKVDQTKYKVEIIKTKTPFLLVFSETFDNGWQLSSGSYKDERNHVKVNRFANAWLMDPQIICQRGGACQRNDDGSYKLEAFVEFTPQRSFWVGLIVSLSTLAIVCGYLIFIGLRSLRSKFTNLSNKTKSTELEKERFEESSDNVNLFPVRIRFRDPFLAALIFLSFLLLMTSPILPDRFSPLAYLSLTLSLIVLLDTNLPKQFQFTSRRFKRALLFIALSFVGWYIAMRGYPPPPDVYLMSIAYLCGFLVAHFVLDVSPRVGTLVALVMLAMTPYYLIKEWPSIANLTASISFSLFVAVALTMGLEKYSHSPKANHND